MRFNILPQWKIQIGIKARKMKCAMPFKKTNNEYGNSIECIENDDFSSWRKKFMRFHYKDASQLDRIQQLQYSMRTIQKNVYVLCDIMWCDAGLFICENAVC